MCAELEEPFGTWPNDLALTEVFRTIENTVREMLGDLPVPEPPPPADFNHP